MKNLVKLLSKPVVLAVAVATLFSFAPASAEVSLAGLFGDHMVLQMGHKLPIWGWAEPGEQVKVYFGSQQEAVVASADGSWKVEVGPFGVGGPFELVVAGSNMIRLSDVWVGEVWLCSGQSNMAMQVKSCKNAEEEIASSANPMIRQFFVPRVKAGQPQDTLARKSGWQLAGPETVGNWTGVGYFFARELNARLGVPVGIINSAWGGTVVEAWTSKQALEANSSTKNVMTDWPGYNDDENWLREMYAKHLKEKEEAKAAGKPEPVYFNQPTVLFNGMINPLIPFAIRGATWYQGESNAFRAYQYRDLLPTMIGDWRSRFGIGDFPFLIVQLAGFGNGDGVWPELREAQTMALGLPNTGMAVAIDVGEEDDVHPLNKQDVGIRLARSARAVAYMDDIVFSGPMFDSMAIQDGRAIISFTHTGQGLVALGGKQLGGFEMAGDDQEFVPAEAMLDGEKVVVWSDEVASPVAVRYAWRDFPAGANLYNEAEDGVNLPAVPFRTDDWKGKTADNR
jgi:sialate O-acetylesterase